MDMYVIRGQFVNIIYYFCKLNHLFLLTGRKAETEEDW